MPIVSMREILKDAREKNYAVGCYNAINLDMARGVIKAAEEENSPVILCHAEIHFKYTPLEMLAPILINIAEKAKVPVAILLDHGKSYESSLKAMNIGFNAVMYDGSNLPYKENVSNTKEIVKAAKTLGVSVEGELGYVVRPKSGGADGDEEDSVINDTTFYTDPDQAHEFVSETGVDALAIAFGTTHGVYLKEPKLDLERLHLINKKIDIPLVMHGGSGLTDEDYRNSIENGISKINFYTGMAVHSAKEIEKYLKKEDTAFYHHLMMTSIDAFAEYVKKTIRIIGSRNRA